MHIQGKLQVQSCSPQVLLAPLHCNYFLILKSKNIAVSVGQHVEYTLMASMMHTFTPSCTLYHIQCAHNIQPLYMCAMHEPPHPNLPHVHPSILTHTRCYILTHTYTHLQQLPHAHAPPRLVSHIHTSLHTLTLITCSSSCMLMHYPHTYTHTHTHT